METRIKEIVQEFSYHPGFEHVEFRRGCPYYPSATIASLMANKIIRLDQTQKEIEDIILRYDVIWDGNDFKNKNGLKPIRPTPYEEDHVLWKSYCQIIANSAVKEKTFVEDKDSFHQWFRVKRYQERKNELKAEKKRLKMLNYNM